MSVSNLKIIVAIGENNEIGAKGKLLWHLPNDMKWFKQNTIGNDVIMGRKTYDSFPEKYKPLPNRTNIVITKNKSFNNKKGLIFCHSIEEAIAFAKKCKETENFIIGGATIYKETIALCDELVLTQVHATFPEADAFFPDLNPNEWHELWREDHSKNQKNPYDYSFIRMIRK